MGNRVLRRYKVCCQLWQNWKSIWDEYSSDWGDAAGYPHKDSRLIACYYNDNVHIHRSWSVKNWPDYKRVYYSNSHVLVRLPVSLSSFVKQDQRMNIDFHSGCRITTDVALVDISTGWDSWLQTHRLLPEWCQLSFHPYGKHTAFVYCWLCRKFRQ